MSRKNWFRLVLAASALAFMLGVARPASTTLAGPTPTPTPVYRGGDPGHGG